MNIFHPQPFFCFLLNFDYSFLFCWFPCNLIQSVCIGCACTPTPKISFFLTNSNKKWLTFVHALVDTLYYVTHTHTHTHTRVRTIACSWRHFGCYEYRHWKWTQWPEFEPWTTLFVFPIEKVVRRSFVFSLRKTMNPTILSPDMGK